MPATSKPVFEGPKTLKVMLMKPAALLDYPYSLFGEIQYTYVIIEISDMEHKKIKVSLPPKTFFINKKNFFSYILLRYGIPFIRNHWTNSKDKTLIQNIMFPYFHV